jgi:outer membrane receptor for monomeric catechols
MKTDASELIDHFNNKLTRKQLLRFIKMARPEINSHYLVLSDLLKKQQWSLAKTQAHKLKTTISLFSQTDLVVSLDSIEAKNINVINTPAFQTNLGQQYQSLLDSIDDLLKHGLE